MRKPSVMLVLVALCASASAAGAQQQSVEEDPATLLTLGVLYIQENQPSEAIRYLRRAADLYPENAETHMWLGFAYFLTKEYNEAEESYLRALAHNPTLTEAHNYLATLWATQGKIDDAIEEYKIALADPAYQPSKRFAVYLNIGRLYLDENSPEEALLYLRNAVELSADASDASRILAHVLFGDTLQRLGRFDEAMAALNGALAIDSQNPDAQLQLGFVHRSLGNKEDACSHFQQVLLLAPGTPLSERARAARGQINC